MKKYKNRIYIDINTTKMKEVKAFFRPFRLWTKVNRVSLMGDETNLLGYKFFKIGGIDRLQIIHIDRLQIRYFRKQSEKIIHILTEIFKIL